jgi:hypothetical protein
MEFVEGTKSRALALAGMIRLMAGADSVSHMRHLRVLLQPNGVCLWTTLALNAMPGPCRNNAPDWATWICWLLFSYPQ